MTDYKEWFDHARKSASEGQVFLATEAIEQMYQAFKARMMDEMREEIESEVTRRVVNLLRNGASA